MEFKDGKCPFCGSTMKVPEESEHCYCSACGQQVLSSAALSTTDYSMPTTPTPDQPSYTTASYSPYSPSGQSTSFLAGWKTQAAFVALGVVCSVLLNVVLNQISSSALTYAATMITLVVSLAYTIFCLVYAAAFYPSLFTYSPKVKSNTAVSFLNGFVGGIIFGCIWCSNLTKKQKGVSYIVFIALMCVSFVVGFFV